MKRLHSIIALLLTVCAAFVMTISAQAASVSVTVDDKPVSYLSAQPYTAHGGQLMLPLRDTANAANLQVRWDAARNGAIVSGDIVGKAVTAVFSPRSFYYTVYGSDGISHTEKCADTLPALQDGTLFISAGTFEDAFGYTAIWNDDSLSLSPMALSPKVVVTEESDEALLKIFLNLLEENATFCEILFPNRYTTAGLADMMSSAYTTAVYQYPELGNYVEPPILRASVNKDGLSCTLTFQERADGFQRKQKAFDGAEVFLRSLYQNGTLCSAMTERERAYAILLAMRQNVQYKKTDMLSYTAWSVFERGSGVCQAYTAAYNLLLKKDGIACRGQEGFAYGQGHIWTVARLDGHEYHIDATWDPRYYFALTADEMAKDHTWR